MVNLPPHLPLTPPNGPHPDLLAVANEALTRFKPRLPTDQAQNMALAVTTYQSIDGLAGNNSKPAEYLARSKAVEQYIT